MCKNPVVYWELASHDAEATKTFLCELFDWDVEWDDRIGLYDFPVGDDARAAGGGVFTLRKAKLPFLTLYVCVDDIVAMAAKVEELGGFIVEGPIETPGGSHICLFNEPSGVTLAMIEPAKKAE